MRGKFRALNLASQKNLKYHIVVLYRSSQPLLLEAGLAFLLR